MQQLISNSGGIDQNQGAQSQAANLADFIEEMLRLVWIEHQIDQFQPPELPQVPHESLQRRQQLPARAEQPDPLGVVARRHVARKGELERFYVTAHADFRFFGFARLFGVPGDHVHEFVEVVEVQHRLESQVAEVFSDLGEAHLGS